MSEPVRIPLTFERGIVTIDDASVLPTGAAVDINNWTPAPFGGLRVRRRWTRGSVDGLPSPRKARGIGSFVSQTSTFTPHRRQQILATLTSGSSLGATWDKATLSGDLLVAIVVAKRSGSAPTITPPAGWATNGVTDQTWNGGLGLIRIYTIINASSRSGTETFTFNSNTSANIHMFELKNFPTSGVIDVQAGTSGTSTTADSGTTGTTTQADEYWLAVHASAITNDFSAPTNGFSELEEADTTQLSTTTFKKVVSATGTARVQSTLTSSAAWGGKIVTFKGLVTGPAITTGKYVVAHEDTAGNEQELYHINRDALTDASWALVEAVSNSSPFNMVAFAAGLGQLLHSSIGYPSNQLRRWDGTTAATVAGSPAGRALAYHKNRFFSAGTAANPTRVWYSALGDYSSWPAANFVEVGQTDGEVIEDIAPTQDGLLIAKASSVHLLSGNGPASFQLHALDNGGAYPGRSICVTPAGVFVAAARKVFRWTGGVALQEISNFVDNGYLLEGDFCSTAYQNEVLYICDEGTGTVWCYHTERNVWWKESVLGATEQPAVIAHVRSDLLYGPKEATTVSLLQSRTHPGSDRLRDDAVGQEFTATTADIWVGQGTRPFTPQRLYLQLRQRGPGDGFCRVTVTPIYDQVEQDPHEVFLELAAGMLRARVDVGDSSRHFGVQYRFDVEVTATTNCVVDLEAIELVGEVETDR